MQLKALANKQRILENHVPGAKRLLQGFGILTALTFVADKAESAILIARPDPNAEEALNRLLGNYYCLLAEVDRGQIPSMEDKAYFFGLIRDYIRAIKLDDSSTSMIVRWLELQLIDQ